MSRCLSESHWFGIGLWMRIPTDVDMLFLQKKDRSTLHEANEFLISGWMDRCRIIRVLFWIHLRDLCLFIHFLNIRLNFSSQIFQSLRSAHRSSNPPDFTFPISTLCMASRALSASSPLLLSRSLLFTTSTTYSWLLYQVRRFHQELHLWKTYTLIYLCDQNFFRREKGGYNRIYLPLFTPVVKTRCRGRRGRGYDDRICYPAFFSQGDGLSVRSGLCCMGYLSYLPLRRGHTHGPVFADHHGELHQPSCRNPDILTG